MELSGVLVVLRVPLVYGGLVELSGVLLRVPLVLGVLVELSRVLVVLRVGYPLVGC